MTNLKSVSLYLVPFANLDLSSHRTMKLIIKLIASDGEAKYENSMSLAGAVLEIWQFEVFKFWPIDLRIMKLADYMLFATMMSNLKFSCFYLLSRRRYCGSNCVEFWNFDNKLWNSQIICYLPRWYWIRKLLLSTIYHFQDMAVRILSNFENLFLDLGKYIFFMYVVALMPNVKTAFL